MITRLDNAFPVSVVSQFMSSPRAAHWDTVIHIFNYLKGTPGHGILYQNHGHHVVQGFIDADYNDDPTSRRLTTGYCVFIGGNLVSWKSKKQNVVSHPSIDLWHRQLANSCGCVIYLVRLGFLNQNQ